MSEDDELEALRRRRMAELQRQQSSGQAEAQEAQRRRAEEEAQKEAVLRAVLDQEARERLSNIRMARPDQAEVLERQLVLLAQSGRLRGKLTDQDLKALLARLFPPQRDINIQRKGHITE
ncbi:MAG: DNA-binding protein [Euryarchaeota archaeon]|nr:DNA-binding protein [Euryarchaeota archaeon]